MGRTAKKRSRNAKLAGAREKAAAARAAERRAAQRRLATSVVGGVVVVALFVGIAVAYVLSRGSTTAVGVASPSLLGQVTNVSQPVAESVAAGAAQSKPQTINGTPLGTTAKPTLLYIGAEFCPFCAAQRWAIVNALSRFGTFTGLQTIRSSESNLATFSFVKSNYTSTFVTFDSREEQDQNHKTLQPLTKTQQAQWDSYLAPGATGTGFPFMDLGGSYVFVQPLVDPGLLNGKSWSQIGAAMAVPTSSLGKAEIGAANYITSTICRRNGAKPATVCTAPILSLTTGLSAYAH